MSTDILTVESLGKRYVSHNSEFKRFANWFGASVKPSSEFWALREVSFVLNKGEAVALIGQNGAGKSTLLKLVTGTIRPTTGRVVCHGRISALLELGLGFNLELTGRQNVYQAGGLMGYSGGTLMRLLPAIEDFAEIGAFFDQPLRTYSSGMQARLAFSLATAVQPDLLIVDEILSVGDSYFQHKSFSRIREFKENGASILFVTHGMSEVRTICDRAILIDKGRAIKDGFPDEVVDFYNAMIAEKENAKLTIEQRRNKQGWAVTRSGTKKVVAESVLLLDPKTGGSLAVVDVAQPVLLKILVKANDKVDRLVLGVMLRDRMGHIVWGCNTAYTKQIVDEVRVDEEIEFVVSFDCNLGPGSYSVTYALVQGESHVDGNFEWVDNHLVFDVVNFNRPKFIGTNYVNATFSVDRIIAHG